MNKPMVYESVTPQQVVAMRKRLRDGGQSVAALAENAWRIEGMGIIANASYDAGASRLSVEVVSKPFIVPTSAINGGILKALGRA